MFKKKQIGDFDHFSYLKFYWDYIKVDGDYDVRFKYLLIELDII